MTDIVEWLLRNEAADEIERLRAAKKVALQIADERAKEANELRARNAKLVAELANTIEGDAERVEKLERRHAKLVADLQRIIDHHDMRSEMYTSDADLAIGMKSIARAAIEGNEK